MTVYDTIDVDDFGDILYSSEGSTPFSLGLYGYTEFATSNLPLKYCNLLYKSFEDLSIHEYVPVNTFLTKNQRIDCCWAGAIRLEQNLYTVRVLYNWGAQMSETTEDQVLTAYLTHTFRTIRGVCF